MAVYQTYINAMNEKIRKAININNPFVFKHISNLKVSGGRWRAAGSSWRTCWLLPPEHGPL